MNSIEIYQQIILNEALVYVAGYVAHQFRMNYPFLGIPTQELPFSDPPS